MIKMYIYLLISIQTCLTCVAWTRNNNMHTNDQHLMELPKSIQQNVSSEGIYFNWNIQNKKNIDHFEFGAYRIDQNGSFIISKITVSNKENTCVITNLQPYTIYATYFNVHYKGGKVKSVPSGTLKTWPEGNR